VDLDELFLPDPFDLSGIDDFLDLKNHSDIATICFDRNQAARPTDQDSDEKTELLFEHIGGFVERKEDHPTDNRKCVHRPGNLVVPFVHWPLLLRDGKSHKDIIYSSEGEYLRLLHASSKRSISAICFAAKEISGILLAHLFASVSITFTVRSYVLLEVGHCSIIVI
jgi:hypothetical protein